MKIQQKIYVLGSTSGKPLAETDNLLLAINGKPTVVNAQDFFSSYTQYDDSIKGHSILGEFPIVDNRIQISEDMNISFWNKNQDEEILLTKYRFPMFQFGDKEIDGEIMLEKIKSLIEVKEEEIKAEIEGEKIDIKSEVPVVEEVEEVEEEAKKLEEEEENELVAECKPYEEGKAKLIAEGWNEFSVDNFRLLFKPGIAGDGAKAQLLYLVDSETFQDVKFEVMDKDVNTNYYKLRTLGGEIIVLSKDKLTIENE